MATSSNSSVLDPHEATVGAEFGDSSHANPDLAPTTKRSESGACKTSPRSGSRCRRVFQPT